VSPFRSGCPSGSVRSRNPLGRHDRVVTDTQATSQIGHPRSPADADALARFDRRMALPLIVAAVVPLFLLPGGANPMLAAVVFIVSWLVFLVDLVVRERRLVHYLATWLGRFDLLVVVLTAPWFLIIGTADGKFVILVRLARVARVVMATRGARRLFQRLGAVALVAVGVTILGAAVAYRAEHAANPGFKTFGDALWWAVVTLTTVGYGDIVPETTAGRVDGVMIMIAGVAVLGLLAGSMASFFGLGTDTADSPPTPASDETRSRDAVVTEIVELRTQVARLVDEVARLGPPHDGETGRSPPRVPT
jgi:voltage-gated potassium channel